MEGYSTSLTTAPLLNVALHITQGFSDGAKNAIERGWRCSAKNFKPTEAGGKGGVM